jgi:peptide/nickel transport system substrate-binding protein
MRIVLLLTIALATLACGPATQQVRESGPADQPKRGGSIHLSTDRPDFFDLDPTYGGQSSPNYFATMLAYDRLLDFKAGPDVTYGDFQLVPSLAEKWQVSPDGRAFTFNIRKGAKYANVPPLNAREFTSADVKWTIDYHQRTGELAGKNLPKGSYTFTTEGIDRIDTPDSHTITVRFKEPFVPFLNYVPTYNLVMLPREIYQEDGHLKNRMVGTGPFQMDEAAGQKGTRSVFKRHPEYWDKERPYLEEVRYLVLPEERTRVAAFQTKQLDYLDTNTLPVYNDLTAIPNVITSRDEDPAPYTLYVNAQRSPVNDIRVRKAISYAIDRDEFLKVMTGGDGVWRLAGSRTQDWTPEEVRQLVKYDPTETKRLLAEAGYANGLNLKILNRDADAGGPSTQEQLLQSQLKKAGINADIESVTKAEGAPRLYGGLFDVIILWEKRFADVDSFLYDQTHSSGVKPLGQNAPNWTRVNDPKLDQLIEAQRAALDPAQRTKVLKDAARHITEQAYHLALYPRFRYRAWQPYLKGYYPQDMQDDRGVKDMWLDK